MAQRTRLRLQQLSGSLDASAGTSAFSINQRVSDILERTYLNFDTSNTVIELGSAAAGATSGVQIDGAVTGAALSTDLGTDNANNQLASAQAIKTYVDNVAQGLDIKDSVRCATTGAMATHGANAVLTYNFSNDRITMGANGIVGCDNQSLKLNDRFLLKNQSAAPLRSSGIYTVTNAGNHAAGNTISVQASSIASNTNQVITVVDADGSANMYSSTAFSSNAANLARAQGSERTIAFSGLPADNQRLAINSTQLGANQVIVAETEVTTVTSTGFGNNGGTDANEAAICIVAQNAMMRISVGNGHDNITNNSTLSFQVDHNGTGGAETFTMTFSDAFGASSGDWNNRAANIRIGNSLSAEAVANSIRTLFTAAPTAGSGFNSGAGSDGWVKDATGDVKRNGGTFKGFTVRSVNNTSAYNFSNLQVTNNVSSEIFVDFVDQTPTPTNNDLAEKVRVIHNSLTDYESIRDGNSITTRAIVRNANRDLTYGNGGSGVVWANQSSTFKNYNATKSTNDLAEDIKVILNSVPSFTATRDGGAVTFRSDLNGRNHDLTVAKNAAGGAWGSAQAYNIDSSTAIHGLYKVVTEGTAGAAMVAERTKDSNNAGELTPGAFVFVEVGSLADTGFVMNSDEDYDFTNYGVVPTFTQFTGAGSVTAGDGLSKTGDTIDLDASLTTVTSVLNAALVAGRDADNQIKFGTDNQIIFRVDGADNVIFKTGGEIEAASLDISGDVDVDGTLEADAITVDGVALGTFIRDTVGTNMVSSNTESGITVTYDTTNDNLDFAVDAAQTGITSLLAADIKIGEDDQTKIDFETADEIHFYAANAEQVYVADGIFGPQTDSDVDLGAASVAFKDLYIDGIELGHASANTLTAASGVLSIEGKSLGYATKKFSKVIGASGQSANAEINTGMTLANFGAISTSSGGALHTTEVYVNGQLLHGGADNNADNDYYEGDSGAGYIAFEWDLEAGDVLQVIVRNN